MFVLIWIGAVPVARAQYGNEWIDPGRTYWKFRVGAEGICRIPKSELDAAGIPATVSGTDFLLYRDGREIALYTSTEATLSGADYLEFYGYPADGKADKELYLDPAKQADEDICLFSDTAAYFLTYAAGAHLRYHAVSTPIPAVPPSPPLFRWQTLSFHGKNAYLQGKSTQKNNHFYSSQFDAGEGYIDALANAGATISKTFATPNRVSAPVNAVLRLSTLAYNYYDSAHKIYVYFNNVLQADSTYGAADNKKFRILIPAASLNASNTLSSRHYATAPSPDWYGWASWSLEYPANFTVTGLDYVPFRLDASSVQQYLEFTGFRHGGVAPRLYDLSNNKWYTGDISVSGQTRFYIDALPAPAQMVLCAAQGSRVDTLSTVRQLRFTDYNAAVNQGDYIIISHRNFTGGAGGKDYIGDYKNYRSSAAGGNYRVVVASTEDLYDQFAYGVDAHPLGIRHFLDYAYDKWSAKPAYVFLVGKPILLNQYRKYQSLAGEYNYEGHVPAFGNPGSDIDFVNDRNTWKMKMAISRLPAWTGAEVSAYLDKVRAYEAALAPAALPTPATELWKKEVLHIAGGDGTTPNLQSSILLPTLNDCKDIISRKPLGSHVTTVAKNTKGLPSTIADKTIDSLVAGGLSMITYYGHGSAYSLDYNLRSPSGYNSLPKIPFFSAFGCAISDIFQLAQSKTVSEDWVMVRNSGAIASLAPSNLGFTSFHNRYMPAMYRFLSGSYSGRSIGDLYKACNDSLSVYATPGVTSSSLTHLECYILQGDPVLRLPQPAGKPDFYVDNKGLSAFPVAVTTARDSFRLTIGCYNLGRMTGDTVKIKVEHRNPAGTTVAISTLSIPGLLYSQAISLNIPVNKTRDVGLNRYRVSIDPDNQYEEVSEANNMAELEVFIYSDNIVPVYPEHFGIVYQPGLTLKASTLNVFRGSGAYLFELDTTELFNSPVRKQARLTGRGGLISWKPLLSMSDSTVYYWRCAIDSPVNGTYNWANSSFIYLKDGSAGWNQSHYYQYRYNTRDSLLYGTDRQFRYQQSNMELRVINAVLELPAPYTFYQYSPFCKVLKNGSDLQTLDCNAYGTIQFIVIDSASGTVQENPEGGQQGSIGPCQPFRNRFAFCYSLATSVSRNAAMKFLDSIPDGYYVLVKNMIQHPQWRSYYINKWMDDTLVNGSGRSLYHSMRNLGFTRIDSFYQERAFSMLCRKGSATFPVQQYVAKSVDELIDITYTLPITDHKGKMSSVTVGPVAAWKTLRWRTSGEYDTAMPADSSSVKIMGIDATDRETVVYEGGGRDVNIDFINARTYPRLRLQWYSQDTVWHTAPQLDYWRILYHPLPEAALDPAAWYRFRDTVHTGEEVHMETAISSLNEIPMDSMLLRYRVIDAKGVSHAIADKRFRKLGGNDTLHVSLAFDPKPYPGLNYLFLEANPENDQPELYHPNNLGYLPFVVKTDESDPVIDVTFDGEHILDRDIISSRPFIKVLMRDENKYMALIDTSHMKLFMRYPSDGNSVRRRISFDGSQCRFIPADMSSGKNEAFIEYRPEFTEDGIYQLFVSGEDASGNGAGSGADYSISFEVVNRSTISNLLNYPNPFSTATSFVFTLTGWQVPSQMKIQILTVTGKVVREISKQELGPIRIGRNRTEYQWDGRDQYGQELGNGVYLYRVVTSIDGKDIERRNSAADRFYKNGYSKMYIMR